MRLAYIAVDTTTGTQTESGFDRVYRMTTFGQKRPFTYSIFLE